MPLVSSEPSEPRGPPPWRGLVVGVIAGLLFIVLLAFVARATRDGAGPVRPASQDAGPMQVDAGASGALEPHDAGDAADAAVVVGASPEPDAGPVGAAEPPVDARAIGVLAQPILEQCLRSALRFDPGLGGRVLVRAEVRGRTVRLRAPAGASPVFGGCVEAAAPRLEGGPVSVDVEVRVALDGLRGTVTIEDASIVSP